MFSLGSVEGSAVSLYSPSALVIINLSIIRGFTESLRSQKGIAGGAAVLALTQFLASFAGLIRDRVLAATFPPGMDELDVVSVYIASFRPSDLLFQMFIMSALAVAVVPLLAGHLAHGRKEHMDCFLSQVLVFGSLLFGALSILLWILIDDVAPQLVSFKGESLDLYVHFVRLACLTNFIFVSGNAFGQYLVAKQTYWWYGLSAVLYTLGTIAGTVWLTPHFGVMGPMYGTVFGAFLYTAVRGVDVWRIGYRFSARNVTLSHPEMKEVGILMLPRMIALGAMQLMLLLFDAIASGLSLGSVTVNAYARNFQAAVVGIVGIALAQSCYSLLSQAIARREIAHFWLILKKGIVITLILTIPGAILLSLLSKFAANLVHLTEPRIIETFVVVLSLLTISIPFECLNHLFLRACFASKHSAFPAMVSVIGSAIAITGAWFSTPLYGVSGIAVSFVVGQFVESLLLFTFLKLRVRNSKHLAAAPSVPIEDV